MLCFEYYKFVSSTDSSATHLLALVLLYHYRVGRKAESWEASWADKCPAPYQPPSPRPMSWASGGPCCQQGRSGSSLLPPGPMQPRCSAPGPVAEPPWSRHWNLKWLLSVTLNLNSHLTLRLERNFNNFSLVFSSLKSRDAMIKTLKVSPSQSQYRKIHRTFSLLLDI